MTTARPPAAALPPAFAGTMFVPHGARPLQQCLDRRGEPPVFAKDLPASSRGAKRYFACGYLHFAKRYERDVRSGRTPSVHEVLRPGRASRVFVDLDCRLDQGQGGEAVEVARERGQRLFAAFAKHMARRLRELLPLDDLDGPDGSPEDRPGWLRVLDASTATKLSQHLVADVFVRDVDEVRSVVADLVETFQEPSEARRVVDMGIYARNHCLRLPWSCKPARPEGVLRVVSPDAPDPTTARGAAFDRDLLFACLIQCKRFEDCVRIVRHRRFNGDGAGAAARPTAGGGSGSADGRGRETWIVPTSLLDGYIRRVFKDDDVKVSTATRCGNQLKCIVLGASCPHVQRPHRSNNQFCNIVLGPRGARGWFTCSDSDCPPVAYAGSPLSFAFPPGDA